MLNETKQNEVETLMLSVGGRNLAAASGQLCCTPGRSSARQRKCMASFLRWVFLLAWYGLREMGGSPMNPAPRNHFLMWIDKIL